MEYTVTDNIKKKRMDINIVSLICLLVRSLNIVCIFFNNYNLEILQDNSKKD
ncbi:MAG: hypothetical protein JG762_945 [Deferribacteraceae bacterium]|jgi:hypothetical protein|nr:hypothetical protein [Deferribacteraceae bacterium]